MKKKIGSRFGPVSRYGKRLRDELRKVEVKTKARYRCPSCSRIAIKRESHGVWKCRKCGAKIASGAFEFKEE